MSTNSKHLVYHTKELTFTVRPDNIIEMCTNANFKGSYSLDAVEENLAVMEEAIAGKRRATLLYFPDVYVRKEVLKEYANSDLHTVASALLAKSFASKLVGNLFLSLTGRFNAKLKDRPTKVFTEKEAAIKWLLEHLAKDK
jgi:hypothetical protein